jgi:chitin disaccharide deacetylase
MKDTKLIINADDLGMSRGITDGILVAHRYGFLTSASLLVNMPASEYAVERVASAPKLGVGVHLNICQGRPISPLNEVRSLVGADGKFHPAGQMIRKLWAWRIDARELETEFCAQIRWAKNRGLELTHADSHHHMHIYPAALRAFSRALAAEGILCARAARCTQWAADAAMGGPHEGGLLRRLCVQGYRATVQATFFGGLISPGSRISFLSRERHHAGDLKQAWRSTLQHLPGGTFELACHPGLYEEGFSETDRICAQREAEFRWLTDPELREIVAAHGIQLITYRELCERRAVRHAASAAVAQRHLG